MDKAAVVEALKKFRAALEDEGVRVTQLILFGSHARGVARPDSDIDPVVISDDFTGKTHWQRIELLSRAIRARNVLIETVAVTPDEWASDQLIIREYARDGEIIAA